jgi:two-component system, OmpR family, phosphate regulon response regulator PhoB
MMAPAGGEVIAWEAHRANRTIETRGKLSLFRCVHARRSDNGQVVAPSTRPQHVPMTAPLFGKHALIIEDEMLIALEVESLLHEFGFESCDIVDNPTDALTSALAHRPDLVTADMRILGGTGIDAMEAITERLGPVPHIYVTGNPDMLSGQTAAPVVDKPLTRRALAEACQRACAA